MFYKERLVIYLSKAQMVELERLAVQTGRPRSELGREAIQVMLGAFYDKGTKKEMVDQAMDERVA